MVRALGAGGMGEVYLAQDLNPRAQRRAEDPSSRGGKERGAASPVRKMAREAPGQTLQATALVHEAYLRLVVKPAGGPGSREQRWDGRGHFFAAAAEAMRRILVERARRKRSRKRGGGRHAQDADRDQLPLEDPGDPLEVLAIHEALERLAEKAPRKAELVKLRYFLGCTMAETAQILGIALKTAEEDWTYARAWLRRRWLRDEEKKSR